MNVVNEITGLTWSSVVYEASYFRHLLTLLILNEIWVTDEGVD